MKSTQSVTALLVAAVFGAAPALALAMEQGQTSQGQAFVSGGVSKEELVQLHDQLDRYNLWVVTATKGSGAYMAGVQVRVTDARNNTVLETEMDGPWLLAELPPGRYQVETRYNDEVHRQSTTIDRNGADRQLIFYFQDEADVTPDYRSPFDSNPYG